MAKKNHQWKYNKGISIERLHQRAVKDKEIKLNEQKNTKFGLPNLVEQANKSVKFIKKRVGIAKDYYKEGSGFWGMTINFNVDPLNAATKYSPESFGAVAQDIESSIEGVKDIIDIINENLAEEQKVRLELLSACGYLEDNLAELLARGHNSIALANIQQKKIERDKKMAELEENLLKKDRKIEEVEAKLVSNEEEVECLLGELSEKKETLHNSVKENKKIGAEKEQLQSQLANQETKINELNKEIAEALKKVRKIKGEIVFDVKTEKDLDTASWWSPVTNLNCLADLESMVEDLIEEKNMLKKLREELDSKLKDKEEKLSSAEVANNNLIKQAAKLKVELAESKENLVKSLYNTESFYKKKIHQITGIESSVGRRLQLKKLEEKLGGALLSDNILEGKTLADFYKEWKKLTHLNEIISEKDKEINNLKNDLNIAKKQIDETEQKLELELTAAKRQTDLLEWQLEGGESDLEKVQQSLNESQTENQQLQNSILNLNQALENQKMNQYLAFSKLEKINKQLREDLQSNFLNILSEKDKAINDLKSKLRSKKENYKDRIKEQEDKINSIYDDADILVAEQNEKLNKLKVNINDRIAERDARPDITHSYYNNLVNERNNLEIERDDWKKKWNEESTAQQETQQKLTESTVSNSQLRIDLAQVQSDFQQEQKERQQTQEQLVILTEQHNNCPRKHRKEITEEINQELELNFAENELTFEQLIIRIKELIRGPINDKKNLQTKLAEAQATVIQLQTQLAEKNPDNTLIPTELVNSVKQDTLHMCQALGISLSPEIKEKLEKETRHEKLISLRNDIIKNHLAQQSNSTTTGTEKSLQRQNEWWITLLLISSLIITWLTIFYLIRRQKLRNK